MTLKKRISGDWYVQTINPGNVIDITTDTLTLNGDLVVNGSTTSIQTTETVIQDPTITLGDGNTGTIQTLGIEVQKAVGQYAGLRWNTPLDRWEISSDNATFNPIMDQLEDDTDPHLGGDLNTNGFSIVSDVAVDVVISPGSGILEINSAIRLPETTDQTPVDGETLVYAKETTGGGTGLFIAAKDATGTDVVDEVVSKSKAIVFSLIF